MKHIDIDKLSTSNGEGYNVNQVYPIPLDEYLKRADDTKMKDIENYIVDHMKDVAEIFS